MEVGAGEWNALLARLGLGDVYLTREYVESTCLLEPGEATFLHAAGVVFPCIVRELGDRCDVATPYGYGGPVAADPGAADGFYAAYDEWCEEHGVVSTFVRFHPLYENHRYARIHVEPLGGTVAWRLEGTDPFERLHVHHRRVLRKAERAGFEVDVRESPRLDEFVGLYERTMGRVDADAFYLFGGAYWSSMDGLPCVLVEVRGGGGELAAAVLCFASPPWLHYHLGATSDEGRRLGASHLALLEAARWGRERGYELFHLGGGVGGRRDSLYEFKRRFDPGGEREFAVGKAIHDQAAYRELSGGAAVVDGFFPAYRARA